MTSIRGKFSPPRGRQFHQGDLDGLCGIYSVMNLLRLVGLPKRGQQKNTFVDCFTAIPASRWPHLLRYGVGYRDMQRIFKELRPLLDGAELRVRYPFQRNGPRLNKDYWERFDALFASGAVAAIVGIRKPTDHWIVIQPVGEKVRIIDSDRGARELLVSRAQMHAGGSLPAGCRWLLHPSEFVLLETA